MIECATPLRLPAELGIHTAAETHALVRGWLADRSTPTAGTPDALLIDASQVDSVDGAGVQILMSLSRTLSQREAVLTIERPTTPLRTACDVLGATDLLSDAS